MKIRETHGAGRPALNLSDLVLSYAQIVLPTTAAELVLIAPIAARKLADEVRAKPALAEDLRHDAARQCRLEWAQVDPAAALWRLRHVGAGGSRPVVIASISRYASVAKRRVCGSIRRVTPRSASLRRSGGSAQA